MFGSFELSTRELSTLIWALLFFVWALKSSKVRKALYGVIYSVLNFRIQIIIWSQFLWIALCCFGLYRFGFWKELYFKEVLIWTLFSGLSLTGNAITKHEIDLCKEIKITFTVAAIIGLFLSMHSFALWIELILLPLFTIIFAIHAFAGTREEWEITKRVLDWTIGFFGIFYIGFYCWYFFEHFSVNEIEKQAEVILIIFILTASLIPLLYFWTMYTMYEQLFNLFNMNWFQDKQTVTKYAKRRIFRYSFLNYNRLKALFKNSEFRSQLFSSATKGDIDRAFERINGSKQLSDDTA